MATKYTKCPNCPNLKKGHRAGTICPNQPKIRNGLKASDLKPDLQLVKTLDDNDEKCPKCKASLQGKPIHPDQQEAYGATHFSQMIGIEEQGVYDGVLMWSCPFCNYTWPRFEEGHRLYQKASEIINNAVPENNLTSAILSRGGLQAYAEAYPDDFLDWYSEEYGGNLMESDIPSLDDNVFYTFYFEGGYGSDVADWAAKHPHKILADGDPAFFEQLAVEVTEDTITEEGIDSDIIDSVIEANLRNLTPRQIELEYSKDGDMFGLEPEDANNVFVQKRIVKARRLQSITEDSDLLSQRAKFNDMMMEYYENSSRANLETMFYDAKVAK